MYYICKIKLSYVFKNLFCELLITISIEVQIILRQIKTGFECS